MKFNAREVIKYLFLFSVTKYDSFVWWAYRACSISLSMNTDFPLSVGRETIQVRGCASLLSMTRMMRISDVHFYLYSQAHKQSKFTLSYTISQPSVQCHICILNIKAKCSNHYLQIYKLYRVRFKCFCTNL